MEETYKEQEYKRLKALVELRQEIAKKIYAAESLTEEEIKKQIPNASYEEISNALRNMLVLKLIKKEGFPVKYFLAEEIKEKLSVRSNTQNADNNKIRVSVIIESKSNDKERLEIAMSTILKNLKENPQLVVYESNLAEVVVHDDSFFNIH